MTIKGFGPEFIIDGRPLTDYERETLTIYQEELAEVALECNAVIVKVSKLLRFGVGTTNPTTMLKNHIELSEEIGQLLAMTDRMAALPFYDMEAVRRGFKTKCEKLPTFTQFAPDAAPEAAPDAPKKLPICVLAGTRQQYDDWLRRNELFPIDAVYCCEVSQLLAAEFSKLVVIGSFWQTTNCRVLYAAARGRVR